MTSQNFDFRKKKHILKTKNVEYLRQRSSTNVIFGAKICSRRGDSNETNHKSSTVVTIKTMTTGPYFTFMFLVSIFLKIMGKTTNVSIWSIHITWSVHPWRKQVYRKEALELFAEQMVSTLSSNITIRKYLNATFTNCYYSHGTYWRSHTKTHGL